MGSAPPLPLIGVPGRERGEVSPTPGEEVATTYVGLAGLQRGKAAV